MSETHVFVVLNRLHLILTHTRSEAIENSSIAMKSTRLIYISSVLECIVNIYSGCAVA